MYFIAYLLLIISLCLAADNNSSTKKATRKERVKASPTHPKHITEIVDGALQIEYKNLPRNGDIKRAIGAFIAIQKYFNGVYHLLEEIQELGNARQTIYFNATTRISGAEEEKKRLPDVIQDLISDIVVSAVDILDILVKNDGSLYFHQLYSYAKTCHNIFNMDAQADKILKAVSLEKDESLTTETKGLISKLRVKPPNLDIRLIENVMLCIPSNTWDAHREVVEEMCAKLRLTAAKNNGENVAKLNILTLNDSQTDKLFKLLATIFSNQESEEHSQSVLAGWKSALLRCCGVRR